MSRYEEVEDYEELVNVLVFKFYMPDYEFQSKPIAVETKEGMTMRQALNQAKLDFLKYGLRPLGRMHRSHAGMMKDGRITWDEPERLTMSRAEFERIKKRTFWKRARAKQAKRKPWKRARRPRRRRTSA
jgi:hypothetical protein